MYCIVLVFSVLTSLSLSLFFLSCTLHFHPPPPPPCLPLVLHRIWLICVYVSAHAQLAIGSLSSLNSTTHPIKVGVSDAYYYNKQTRGREYASLGRSMCLLSLVCMLSCRQSCVVAWQTVSRACADVFRSFFQYDLID